MKCWAARASLAAVTALLEVVEALQDRLVIIVSGGASVRVRPVADLQEAVARLVAVSLFQPNQGLQS